MRGAPPPFMQAPGLISSNLLTRSLTLTPLPAREADTQHGTEDRTAASFAYSDPKPPFAYSTNDFIGGHE